MIRRVEDLIVRWFGRVNGVIVPFGVLSLHRNVIPFTDDRELHAPPRTYQISTAFFSPGARSACRGRQIVRFSEQSEGPAGGRSAHR